MSKLRCDGLSLDVIGIDVNMRSEDTAVVDPGFPMRGWTHWGGHGPLTQVLFGKNVCKNKRIGSHRGACARHAP